MLKLPSSDRYKAKTRLIGHSVPTKRSSKRIKPPVQPKSSVLKKKQKAKLKPSKPKKEKPANLRFAVPKKETNKPLWKHQLLTMALCKKSPVVFDTSDPGTGKTRGHLESFAIRRRQGGGKLLVLAPKTLLESAWQNDAAEYVMDMSSSVAYAINRNNAFSVDADIHVTNTDAVRWLMEQPSTFFKQYDSIIIDESSSFKHRTSGRSKKALQLVKHFKYRALLTATPTSKTIQEIWHQLMLLDGGKRLGNNFFAFRQAVCEPEQIKNTPHISWVDKDGAEEAVAGLIRDISIRHIFEECMDIPPNHTYTISYKPNAKLRDAYDEMKDRTLMEWAGKRIDAANAAVLSSKLLQIASGAVYAEGSDPVILDNGRTELILDLIEERKHSVVFFNWTHQKKQLIAESEKRGISYAVIDGSTPDSRRTAIVAQYQAGHFQTIYLHPKTGAHGLTLTKGTATIWASPIYLPDFLKQGLHRIWRGGQTLPTETIMIEAEGTLEAKVYATLNKRNKRMKNLLSMLEE